jgi:predicted porin
MASETAQRPKSDAPLMCRVSALILSGALAISGIALAQQKTGPDIAQDDSLTWHGVTLYGVVDIGLQYEDHGAPFSDSHPAGSNNIIQKYSRQSAVGFTPSNMGQSRVGLQGAEALAGDFQAAFRIETFFNPQSGQISDAQKSMVQNNGRSLATQGVNLNSSLAGQAFQSLYGGFSSKTFGTVTFGRQLTLVADGVNKYDPNYGSQAFSLIGMSGTYAGGGDTEDKRLDSSLKYVATFADIIHVGALYKFNGSNGAANTVTELPGLGYSLSNSLSATVSDNSTFAVMGLYKIDPLKLFASFEHIQYANPTTPLEAGFTDIGGYNLAFVNDKAFPKDKVLQLYWAGARYSVLPRLDLTAAWYLVHQNSYGIGATAGCTTKAAGTCSGTLVAYSFDADYTFNRHFDAYIGAMYSAVHDGFANGYEFQTNNINPTIGVRFKF